MYLLVDAGNTRLKWYAWQGRFVRQGWLAYDRLESLADIGAGDFDRVLVSSVRGAAFESQFTSLCQACFAVNPEFISVQRRCRGLEAGYLSLDKLGVDRWLAMLSAYAACNKACIVVDAGTALTIDFVGFDGQHKGGLIVPGAQAMAGALLGSTEAVEVKSLTLTQTWQPGCDTVSCVGQGVVALYKSLMNEILQCVTTEPVGGGWLNATLYLTGGDADAFQHWLPSSAILEPRLVPKGLLLAAL